MTTDDKKKDGRDARGRWSRRRTTDPVELAMSDEEYKKYKKKQYNDKNNPKIGTSRRKRFPKDLPNEVIGELPPPDDHDDLGLSAKPPEWVTRLPNGTSTGHVVGPGYPIVNLAANEKARRFLDTVVMTGSVVLSCEAANVSNDTVLKWREKFPWFQKAFDESIYRHRDRLVQEAKRRAVEGWQEPIFQRGQKVGEVTRYSDKLLELVLKTEVPEYREAATGQMAGMGTVSIESAPLAAAVVGYLAKMSEEQRNQLLAMVTGDVIDVEQEK